MALPPIVVAPLLVLVFAVLLGWLPAGGFTSPAHVVLPAVALALPYLAAFTRLTRGSVAETLAAPHVRTALAKGLPTRRIVARHLLPPALIPVVSFLGPAAAALLAGSMVIEQVFSLPGLGRYFVQGALNRDYTLVMGTVVVYASMILAFNLAVDLAYTRLDPRIRVRGDGRGSGGLGRIGLGRVRLGRISLDRTRLGRTLLGRTRLGRTRLGRTRLDRAPPGRTDR